MKRTLTGKIANGIFTLSAVSLLFCGAVNTLPKLAGFETYAVTSGSMEPAIRKNALILVDPAMRTPVKGAVLTCRIGRDENRTVTHRVEEVNADGTFVLKGDANETADLAVSDPGDVIGTVVHSIPFLGFVQKTDRFKMPLLLAMSTSGVILARMNSNHTTKGEQNL